MADSNVSFEATVRAFCDAAYERPGPASNPVRQLIDGTLDRSGARAFFFEDHWDNALIFNEVVLTHCMEKCPDVEGRVRLWKAIYPEFGRGHLIAAHPVLNRNFLLGLEVPGEKLPLKLDHSKPSVQEKIRFFRGRSWEQILAYFLAIETVGPKVFGFVTEALQKHLGMTRQETMFFSTHHTEDRRDSEVLFRLVGDYVHSSEGQKEVMAELKRFFDLPRYQAYCSRHRPMTYHFVDAQPMTS